MGEFRGAIGAVRHAVGGVSRYRAMRRCGGAFWRPNRRPGDHDLFAFLKRKELRAHRRSASADVAPVVLEGVFAHLREAAR